MKEKSGTTHINFAFCELEGKWRKISKGRQYDIDMYEALGNNCKLSVRIFDARKTKYHLKKGSRITIKGHVLIFDKEDFVERLAHSLVSKDDLTENE